MKGRLTAMAKSRENGTIILSGLEGYERGKGIEEKREIVPELGTDSKRPACVASRRTYAGRGRQDSQF